MNIYLPQFSPLIGLLTHGRNNSNCLVYCFPIWLEVTHILCTWERVSQSMKNKQTYTRLYVCKNVERNANGYLCRQLQISKVTTLGLYCHSLFVRPNKHRLIFEVCPLIPDEAGYVTDRHKTNKTIITNKLYTCILCV